MTTYRTVLESLRTRAESIVESVEMVLDAGGEGWTEADEEDCEVALDRLALAFPNNAHVFRALELSQSNHVADVLNMAVDTVYVARTIDQAFPLDARTVTDAIAEVNDADWRDGRPVSIREVGTDEPVAEVTGARPTERE